MIIEIEITGTQPYIQCKFQEETGEKRDKNLSPREVAEKCLHQDEEGRIFIPMLAIYSAMVDAGKYHKDGKNKITTQRSSLLPAGVRPQTLHCYIEPPEWEILSTPITIPATGGKIMRHRPIFHNWKTTFELELDPKMFHENTLRAILDDAGQKGGIGEWRPSRRGFYGTFKVTKWISKK